MEPGGLLSRGVAESDSTEQLHTHTQCREDYCLQIAVYFLRIRTLNARQILMLPFERARDFQTIVIGSSLPAKLHILWKFHTLEKGTTFNL